MSSTCFILLLFVANKFLLLFLLLVEMNVSVLDILLSLYLFSAYALNDFQVAFARNCTGLKWVESIEIARIFSRCVCFINRFSILFCILCLCILLFWCVYLPVCVCANDLVKKKLHIISIDYLMAHHFQSTVQRIFNLYLPVLRHQFDASDSVVNTILIIQYF